MEKQHHFYILNITTEDETTWEPFVSESTDLQQVAREAKKHFVASEILEEDDDFSPYLFSECFGCKIVLVKE